MLNNRRQGLGGLVPSMYNDTNFDTKDSYLINSPVRNQIVPDHQRRGSAGPYGIPTKLAARTDYDDDLGISDDETEEYDTEYEDPEDKPRKAQKTKGPGFLADLVGNVAQGLAPASKMRPQARRPEAPMPRRRAQARRPSVEYEPPRRSRSRVAQEPYQPQRRRRPERYAPMRRTKLSSLNSVVLNSYPNLGIYKYANPQQQSGFGFKPQPGMLTGGSPGLKNPANAFKTPDFSVTPSNVPAPKAGNNPNTNFVLPPPVQETSDTVSQQAPASNKTQFSLNMLPDSQKRIIKSVANNIGNNLGNTDWSNIHNQVLKDTHYGWKDLIPGVKATNVGPFNTLEFNPYAQMNTGTFFTRQDPAQFLDYNRMPAPTYAPQNSFQNPYNEVEGVPYTGVRIKGTF